MPGTLHHEDPPGQGNSAPQETRPRRGEGERGLRPPGPGAPRRDGPAVLSVTASFPARIRNDRRGLRRPAHPSAPSRLPPQVSGLAQTTELAASGIRR